jgi:hypothetical protein
MHIDGLRELDPIPMYDLHYHAVWAELLVVVRGEFEIALLHCVSGDQPLGDAFGVKAQVLPLPTPFTRLRCK